MKSDIDCYIDTIYYSDARHRQDGYNCFDGNTLVIISFILIV